MKTSNLLHLATAGFLAMSAYPAQAHHAFATEFQQAEGEIRGVVTRVWWTNPHIR